MKKYKVDYFNFRQYIKFSTNCKINSENSSHNKKILPYCNYERIMRDVLFFLTTTPVICLIESSETHEDINDIFDHRPCTDESIYQIKLKCSHESPVQTSDDYE